MHVKQNLPVTFLRVASIDIGTNTGLLLIADIEEGSLVEVEQDRQVIRLGEGLDSSGCISEAAFDRMEKSLSAFGKSIQQHKPDRLVVTGTSASRDASNGGRLIEMVREVLGVEYRILSGKQEAHLTFDAAVDKDTVSSLVVDIGGGSTELVFGTRSESGISIEDAVSFDIGSVRLTERFISGQPVSTDEAARVRDAIVRTLDSCSSYPHAEEFVAVGGTATTLALLEHRIDHASLPGSRLSLSASSLEHRTKRFLESTLSEIFSLDEDLMEGRADVIPAGAMILLGVARKFAFEEIAVSFRGVRHGAALAAWRGEFDGTIEKSPGVPDP